MPPTLPAPTWDGDTWTFRVALPAFRSLLSSRSGGEVPVHFSPEASSESAPPSAEQLATVAFILANQEALHDTVVQAIRGRYDELRPRFAEDARRYPDMFPNFDKTMPPAPTAEVFEALHTLTTIYVQPVVAKGLAFVGFSFGAKWEDEHGVGVVTHGTRVVTTGGADVSFLQWVAKRAAEEMGQSAKT